MYSRPDASRTRFAALLSVCIVTLLGGALSVSAAVSSNVATSLATFGQTIKASSTPTAVLGLNLAGDQTLASTTIGFIFSASGTTTDIAALGIATSSGVAVYRDDKSGAGKGVFDADDDVVPLLAAPTWVSAGPTATTTLTFAAAEVVPANDTTSNAGNDYFIVVQTAGGAVHSHVFLSQMIPTNIGWTGVQPAGPTAVSTNAITVDTVAPTLDVSMTGPANNSTGVPVSTFIHLGFSENLDPTTINPNNVTMTTGVNAVGVALRPFPNGFDIVASSPPTYTASSRFAKASTVSTGFFMINGTNTIFPQGGYTVPVRGDIVFTQTDTFPPEVGLVTNATLTSGTFAINNNPAFRSLQITKFATPTATGYTGDGAVVGVGDLIVANTSAKPTNVRYNWHIVTTGQAVNNAGLRLDNEDTAPTYATTTFARLMPTATSTTDTSGRFAATTTFATSTTLVFAKVLSGADNLGSYAWHLVTNGETIVAPFGAGTTTATFLRLDGAAAPPHFAPLSVIATVSGSATGATDTGAQDATVFSFGDIMFAKASANAANTGAYAFHIVSNGATGATSTSLRLDNSASNLTSSATYIVTAGTGVKDSAGNPLASAATITFTTGSTGGTNTTPPAVQNSQPQMGNQSFAPNAPINLTFSVAMEAGSSSGANSVTNTAVVKLSTSVNGTPTTQVLTGVTNTYDATTQTVTIAHTSALAVSTDYVVQVTTAAKSSTGASFPMEYRLYFKTASAVDNAAPTILGVSPVNTSTGVSMSPVLTAGFSKDMNPATLTTSTVTLVKSSDNSSVAGGVSYSPNSRSVSFVPSTPLLAGTVYKFVVVGLASGVKDLANNVLADHSTTTFTTTATPDNTAPSVSFANADNFGIAITFSEPMKSGGGPNAVDNVANYTLESPPGTTISLGGKTVVYDAGSKTARLSGLALQNGNQYKVTVSAPVQDLAGNGISVVGTPPGNVAFGTVQNSTATGGQLGPGGGTMNFSMQGMNPTRVSPDSRISGATSNYKVEFLAGTAIPIGGQIQLVFPSGFTITNASTTAAATSFCNADINGPMPGVPAIASVSNDNSSGIITITTAASSTGTSAFVCLDVTGVVNSSIPNSSGYTVDIKTRDTADNNRAILETKTSSPFFLGAAGSRTLTANVFNDGNANSSIDANEGIGSVRVFLFSPALGGTGTTTNASGVATFTSLTDGDYMLGIDPGSLAAASSTVTFNSAPQPFTVSATSLTKNFIVSGGGSSVTISGTVTGPANTSVDIFASSNNGFSRTTKTLTGAAVAYSIPVSTNTTYNVGVGPAMPEAFFTPGAPPPPPPTFTFMPPPNISVTVGTTSVSGKNFSLTTASKTITGTVLDSTGSAVSNAGVFARPLSNSSGAEVGFGTGGQTNTSGSFTLNVVPGTYLVGVFKGGMPNVPDQQITVPESGANTPASLAFSLGAGTSLTISGTVKDDGGNAIPYAGVNAHKVVSTSNTNPIGGGTGNFVGGPTDSNGAYTLYVDAGAWIVEAFAPGFGKLGSKTLTVNTSSLSGQDFSAQTLSLGTITGTTTKASVIQQGVMVRAEGSAGANMAVSDANGVYTLKVPEGSYTVTCFFPGVGEGTPLEGVAVTTNTTSYSNNCAVAAPITITVNLTDGTNPVTGAYIDVRSSSGRGNGTNVSATSSANAVYTVTVPPGTYTVRAGHPSYGTIGSTGSVSSTQTITYTTAGGAMRAVTGTVTDGSAGINGAWVSLTGIPTGQTNTITIGAQTDSTGAFTLNVPAGTYTIHANKGGYIASGADATVTVAGAAVSAGTITLTASTQTISGTVTLNSAGVSGAYVDASASGGGFAVAQTDSAGAYSLAVKNGTWTVRAHAMGYEGGPTTVTVNGNSPTQGITLTAISGFVSKPEHQETVTPTAGGLLTNSDIGSNFKMNIPANALGTGSNAVTVKTQTYTTLPNPSSGSVLAKNGLSFSAVDSSGQPIKTLNSPITIVIPYTEADIPTGKTEADLVFGTWNGTDYETLPTTVDTVNNTLTVTISHFSSFAPLVQGDVAATPAASTAVTASSGGGGGAPGSVSISLVKPRAQIIYPDGRIVYVDQLAGESAASAGKSASAGTNASASASAKFTALLKQGSRGTDVKRLQKLLGVEETGFFGPLTRAAVEQFQIKNGIAKKGEAGFGTLGPKTRAKIAEAFASNESAPSVAPSAASTPAVGSLAILAGGKFVRALNMRATGSDVRTLQQILNSDSDTSVTPAGAGSAGNETTYFGPATLKAVQKFQEKHGIATFGDAGYGNVGPKTRAKLNALVAALKATPVTPTTPATPATPPTPAQTATTTSSTSESTTATSTAAATATSTAISTSSSSATASTSVSVTATTTLPY